MPLYNQPNMTEGIDVALVEIVNEVPAFAIGLLVFVWAVVFLGGMASQKRRTGFADAPMWSVMASMSTLMIALIMTIKEGLISLTVLGVVVALVIFSGLWLFKSKARGEQ